MGAERERFSAASAPEPERVPHGRHERPKRAEESEQLELLRELLARPERERIERIEEQLDQRIEAVAVAEVLPDAVALRSASDDRLARALGPTIERGLEEQITRHPARVAEAIYPVLGPAIRRAIAEALSGMAESLNRAIEYSLSWRGLRWRVESWRTGVPFGQVVLRHALVYRVEQVLLVHTTTGLPLAHAAVSAEATRDADLVSGMLTAIRDFVGDSFEPGQGSDLRGATVGDITLFVETGPRAMLAVAVRGQPPPGLRARWQATLETIHFRFAAPLAAFDGDPAPFEPARPLLEDCLETVLQTDRPEGRSPAPRLVWATLALALLVAVAFAVRGHLRWRALLQEIDAQPGVVVLEASRSPLRTRVHGLRDPLAGDPDSTLRERGVSPRRLRSRWESYLSTEPEIVVARARLALAPPPSVSLTFDAALPPASGVLRARGEAPPAWLEVASRAVLPGVAAVDLSGVALSKPPELAAAVDALAQRRVLFEVGSALLDEVALREVEIVASALAELDRLASAAGWVAIVELVGRTDEAGTSEANSRLSVQRAEAVRDALHAAGASGALPLALRGVGSGDPIAPGPDGASSRLNRSVSFAASLEPAATGRSTDRPPP